jgi:hypothetical protein
MRVGSIPAGIAALVVALAVGFAWEMRGTSGGQPSNDDGQPRPHAVIARAAVRGDRIHMARRGDRIDVAQRALARRIFTSRFANAFAERQMAAVDEVGSERAADDMVLAYASPQMPTRRSEARRPAPMHVATAPTRSIVVADKADKPEQPMRLASLGPASSTPDDLDERTAIYDIAAHTVYLPGGEKLEAHSGLGGHIDDPRSVNLHNRGVTPPNTYRLALRERSFHGVRALRLIPIGDGNMHGRDGMLAHTYMLGRSGQSNGCMVMRNYPAFLRAFLDGKVDRLVVVDHLRKSNARIASLR